MLETEIITLPEIAVTGRQGFCSKDNNIVQDLWQQANAHFSEVADIAMRNPDGSFTGFWGAMSDETMAFRPWTDGYTRGWYLAGVEVYADTPVPEGWVRWIMPARTYVVADVTAESYAEVFSGVINKTLPETGRELCGAVCDYTDPATGKNRLFFPVKD